MNVQHGSHAGRDFQLNRCVLAVVLKVFAPASLTFANIPVALDELNRAQPLHHLEPELRLHLQPHRRPMWNGQPLPVHLVGKERLSVSR